MSLASETQEALWLKQLDHDFQVHQCLFSVKTKVQSIFQVPMLIMPEVNILMTNTTL